MSVDPSQMGMFFDPNSVQAPNDPNIPDDPSSSAARMKRLATDLTAFGGTMNAVSGYESARTSAALMRQNAGIAGMQAQSATQSGAENAELYRQKLNQTLGRQAASIGGSNLTMSGSALKSVENTSELGNEDISRIQLDAARRAWGFQVQQVGDLDRARAEQSAGTDALFGNLINTGQKAWGQWNTPNSGT